MDSTGPVTAEEAQLNQARKDQEYLKLCQENGITPDLPKYTAGRYSCNAGDPANDALLSHRQSTLDGGAVTTFDHGDIDQRLGWAEPEDSSDDFKIELHPEAEQVLEWILGVAMCDGKRFSAEAVGIKLIALSWLLQRGAVGAMSQTEIANRIRTTRSNFSSCVRGIQKALGGKLHARAQKSEVSNSHYKQARLRVVANGGGNLRRKVID
ncbi:MAG: hypothetical protein ACOVMP_00460 [Chthoniobacterales bacterium]